MLTLTTIRKTVFATATGVALAFGLSSAALATPARGEPTEECLESGGHAYCATHPSCEYACRQLGYTLFYTPRCDVATRCCYCTPDW